MLQDLKCTVDWCIHTVAIISHRKHLLKRDCDGKEICPCICQLFHGKLGGGKKPLHYLCLDDIWGF